MSNERFNDIFRNRFFQGMSIDEFRNIDLKLFNKKCYNPGEMLIKQDTIGDFMFLITKGEVIISKVVSDEEIELATRCKGDYVGEMSLFDGKLRSANVVAANEVQGYIIDLELFLYLFRTFEQIKINLIRIINASIRDTGIKLGEKNAKHTQQITKKDSELIKVQSVLNETIELKRYIDEQKNELELINRELEKRNKELFQLSIKDGLTHLYTNEHFSTFLEIEFSRSKRNNLTFSILLIEIGNFYEIKGTLGTIIGDTILKETAGIISSMVRTEDLVGRIKGNVFGVILPHVNIDEAVNTSNALLEKLNEISYIANEKNNFLTTYIGISNYINNNVLKYNDLLINAEETLLIAKCNKSNIEVYNKLV